MRELENAKAMLEKRNYSTAGKLLDSLLSKDRDNPELWYLRGLVSLKLKNYAAAHECFERAIFINRKPQYYKVKGMSHLEMFEVDLALDHFLYALKLDPKDPILNFFVFICYVLSGDPRAKQYVERAYLLDKKKTKALLKSFYELFLSVDKSVNPKLLKELESRINRIN